jgi:hypothetical protein
MVRLTLLRVDGLRRVHLHQFIARACRWSSVAPRTALVARSCHASDRLIGAMVVGERVGGHFSPAVRLIIVRFDDVGVVAPVALAAASFVRPRSRPTLLLLFVSFELGIVRVDVTNERQVVLAAPAILRRANGHRLAAFGWFGATVGSLTRSVRGRGRVDF